MRTEGQAVVRGHKRTSGPFPARRQARRGRRHGARACVALLAASIGCARAGGSDAGEVDDEPAPAGSHRCEVNPSAPALIVYDETVPLEDCDLLQPPVLLEYWRPPVFSAVTDDGRHYLFDSSIRNLRMLAVDGDRFVPVPAGGGSQIVTDDDDLRLFSVTLPESIGGGIRETKADVDAHGIPPTEVVLFPRGTPGPLESSIEALKLGVQLAPGGCAAVDEANLPSTGAWNDIDYVMRTAADELLIVIPTRREFTPQTNSTAYFIFFGPPSAIEQREMLRRYGQGNGSNVVFRVGTDEMTARFVRSCDDSRVSSDCPGTLSRSPEARTEVLTPVPLIDSGYVQLAQDIQMRCRLRITYSDPDN